jgi:Single-stranded DNA-binding protein
MLSTITIAGRPTKDPVMQTKGENQYVTLDIAQTQGFGDDARTLYFSCYFSKYLAERLLKANVKKGTCLDITGKFDSKEFTHKDGTPGRSLEIRVFEWDFSIANKNDNQSVVPGNMPPGTQVPNNVPPGQMPPANAGQQMGQNPNAAPPQGGMQPAMGGGYMQPPVGQNYTPPAQGAYPQQAAGGFTAVPQAQAGQLPFPT